MNRRQSAVIRIIAWTIAAVALVVILILGLLGKINVISIGINNGYYYADSGKYKTGNAKIDGNEIKDLELNWLDGRIHVETYDGETVQFYEKASQDLSEKQQLQYYVKNGKLIIQYQKAQKRFFFNNSTLHKELFVKIPEKTAESMGSFRIDTISADAEISGITASQFRLDSTSGDFDLTGCKTDGLSMDSTSGSLTGNTLYVDGKLETNTTSGDVQVEGSFQNIDSDTVSGLISVTSKVCPNKIRTDSVSGNASFTIPENDGFTYKLDTVSGYFNCDFEMSHKEGRGTYKGGGASFRFESVSGGAEVKRL